MRDSEIFKDIFKIIFFMFRQTIPLYLACEKALDVKKLILKYLT